MLEDKLQERISQLEKLKNLAVAERGELMKELISRIETNEEMLEKDPNSDYIQGRLDMAKTILASCVKLTD